MARIKVLSQDLINQISAGEVLERPASAIKELIENSIDAMADKIIIKVEGAGKKRISITDNGIGMLKEDIFNSVKPHATSKLEKSEDLFSITSLGFRGEALASMSAVSRLSIESRTENTDYAYKVYFEQGKVLKEEKTSAQIGTTVDIKDIFLNTPARLKFLKSDRTEQNYVLDTIKNYVFLYPLISFEYYSDKRRVLKFTKAKSRLERLCSIKKTNINAWFHSEFSHNYLRGELFLLKPNSDIRKRDIRLFVNGRVIKDKILNSAITNAYQELSLNKDELQAYLILNIEPNFVDLNVSPTKNEVRFLESSFIYDFIYKQVLGFKKDRGIKDAILSYSYKALRTPIQKSISRTFSTHTNGIEQRNLNFSNEDNSVFSMELEQNRKIKILDSYRILGQFLNKYIVLESGTDLVIIDQHAAHERINYEKIKKEFLNGTKNQYLLEEEFQLTGFTEKELRESLDALNIKYELIDGDFFKIKLIAIPEILEGFDLKELLTTYINTGNKDAIYKKLATISCHSSVRGNFYLPHLEQDKLIEELLKCEYPYACPHGRPTIINFTQHDIERLFERV